MVGVFVGLKVALLRSSLRRSRSRAVGFVVGTTAAVVGASWTSVHLAGARPANEAADLTVLAFTGLAVAWLALPLSFGGGGDESADPTRLVVLPVRPRALITGATAAALVGPGPLCSLILIVGAAAGAARATGGSSAAAGAAVVASALMLLLCVIGSRAVLASFARALTGRRGKDAAALGGVLTAVGGYAAYLLLSTAGSGPQLPSFVVRVLRWTPPGWIADCIRAAAEGRAEVVLAETAAAVALTALLMVWWHRSLNRLMTTVDASTAQAVRERGARSGTTARLLTSSRTLLIAHHQFTSFLRAPRHRMTLIAALAYALLFPVVCVPVGAKSPYVAVGGAWVFGLTAPGVLFAMDGSAIWSNIATLRTRAQARAELAGRMLPQMALIVPWVTATAVVVALLTGRGDQLAAALGLTFALLGLTFAIGMVVSVYWPYPYPEDPFEVSAPGQNGGYHTANFVGTLLGLLAVSPFVVGAVVLEGSPHSWLLLPLGTAYGGLAVVITLRSMARRLHARAPEVLTALRAS
ncbi:transporter [Streptomyces sp. ISL-10]|uniref:transporter n=1 Tax=Streptomyces sp. ISL-10 TaxID=2819172 RepID=UPI001BE7F743|nr:transporter [Streptomyces sp. ISL-10]MBT2367740.1 transporter [Streptomyces sp. ISL-10]